MHQFQQDNIEYKMKIDLPHRRRVLGLVNNKGGNFSKCANIPNEKKVKLVALSFKEVHQLGGNNLRLIDVTMEKLRSKLGRNSQG